METLIITDKTNRRIIHNREIVQKLYYFNNTKQLYTQTAINMYKEYLYLQDKLIQAVPYNKFHHFEPNEHTCNICNFPVVSMLEKHHVIPRSKGGRIKVNLCPSCHCAVHKAVDEGDFNYVYEHLNNIEHASTRFGIFVDMCV